MAQKNIIKRIISSPLVQTFLIYVSGGWIVLEMTDFLINNYNLNDRIRDILLIIFVSGLPIAIFLAWFLSRDKADGEEKLHKEPAVLKSKGLWRLLRRKPWFSIPGVLLLILLLASGIAYIHRQVKIHWAMTKAIPMMKNFVEEADFVNAFQIYQKARHYFQDEAIKEKWDVLVPRVSVLTEPEGVEVYLKVYPDLDGEWQSVGTTPIMNLELPWRTIYRWRFEKPGYDTVYAVAPTAVDTIYRTLHRKGNIPEGMVYVEGINDQITGSFLSKNKQGFFIDKYEVTNRQYKSFIDNGGYQNPEYWRNDFVLEGDTLTFEQAMIHFVDETGRPGPSTWVVGDYPDGQEEYPVNGISWYEADAYATFAGKSIPTYWHWWSASGNQIDPYSELINVNLIPLSNFGGQGPEPVGNNPGISCFGTYDMAGNVREWCWNKAPTERAIFGGAWNDVSYMSQTRSQLPAFDRSPKNGLRCVIYPELDSIPEDAFQPVPLWNDQRDFYAEEPFSDLEFEIHRQHFLYDNSELNSQIEEKDETHEDYILEIITFDAVYEDERMMAYLFLPKEYKPPYQTILFFPGSYAYNSTSLKDSNWPDFFFDYLMKSGRAVMFPIYKGTYERREGACYPLPPGNSHQYTDCLIKWVKDFSRSIDYLESREDIDTTHLGLLGDSWGGYIGLIIPAVEPRLKTTVLLRGGLLAWNRFPEAEEFNYLSHIEMPLLMLNGIYDPLFPYESSVQPAIDLIGTPEEHKKLVLFECDHFIPKNEMIKEVLNWLDKYFGPVSK